MIRINRALRLALPLFLLPAAAAAQDAGPPGNGLDLTLGALVLWGESALAGVGDDVMAVPWVSLEYGRFYWIGVGAGFRTDPVAGFEVEIGIRGELESWCADDSPVLDGMDDRDPTIEAGLAITRALPGGFEVAVDAWHDVLGVHRGWSASAALARPLVLSSRWVLVPECRWTLLGGDKAAYYYGVPPSEATAARPAYNPGNAWTAGCDIQLRYLHGEHLSFFGGVGLVALSDRLADSPIIGDDVILSLGVGTAWHF